MKHEQRNLAKEIPITRQRADLVKDIPQLPTPEEIAKDKKQLTDHKDRVLAEIGKIERHVLDSPNIPIKQILHSREEVQKLSAVWNWLHGIEYNKYTLPEQQAAAAAEQQAAAAAEQEKDQPDSKIVTFD